MSDGPLVAAAENTPEPAPDWSPVLGDDGTPRYLAIADAIERDVQSGALACGARLPTHRDLARVLGITVGTVSRGYAEAERRGLTVGEVGRGTFVRPPTQRSGWAVLEGEGETPEVLNFSHSLPVHHAGDGPALAAALRAIAAEGPDLAGALTRFHPDSGLETHRAAGAEWFGWSGLECTADEVQLTAGVQHGLSVTLGALVAPGETLLASELTYPGLMPLARMLGIRLRGVAMTAEGMDPDALEHACSTEPRARAVYVVPTIQNPVAGTLPEAARERIVEVAAAHDLLIVEDEIHGLMPPTVTPPIARMAPDRTVCLAGPSKSLVPGLRVGFVRAPEPHRDAIGTAIRSTLWMAPPLTAEVFHRWMVDGTAQRMLAEKRADVVARQAILAEVLSGLEFNADPHGYHAWVTLPEPWRSGAFVRAAREAGVHVADAGAFAVGRAVTPAAVRLSIGLVSEPGLRRGLEVVRSLLRGDAGPALTIV